MARGRHGNLLSRYGPSGVNTPLECDVLIVGGGPAGLSVAAALPDNVTSIVVHQDAEIGKPVRTSGGSWLRDVQRLGIPPEYYQIVDQLDIFSDQHTAAFKLNDNKLVVLNITDLYQWLAQKSEHKPSQLLLGTKFLSTELMADGHYISTLRSRQTQASQIKSKYIVDGSGVHCSVLQSLGLKDKPERTGVGIEYEYPIGTNRKDRAILFVGSSVLAGYGWVFPTADGKLRVGVGVIHPDTDASPKALMERFLTSNDVQRFGLELGDDYEVNAGTIPSIPYDPQLVFGNVIRIGDAANVATPTAGEGIRICIENGTDLGIALGQAIQTQNTRPLLQYEARCKKAFGRNYHFGFLANQRFSKYDAGDWNKSIRRISYLSESDLVALIRSEFSLRMILRTLFKGLKKKIIGPSN
jgi:digeranylgeranylglycerophospholipid reductase